MFRQLAAPLLLALTAAGAVVAVDRRQARDEPAPLRTAVLKAAVLLGLFTTASIEVLSAIEALRAALLAVAWGLLLIAAWGTAWIVPRRPRVHTDPAPSRFRPAESLSAPLTAALAACAVFAGVAFVIAIVAPPNNWDSMSYHMPRVAHWLANASVRHYPSSFTPQLFMPPFNAYAIATVQALAATDRFANTVQWLAYVGSSVAASVIVDRIGGGRDAQGVAAVLVLTIPMAVSQASTTQADMLTAAWLMLFVAFVAAPPSRANVLWAGASLGLGILTKPTFALYAAPFAMVLCARFLRRSNGAADAIGRVALSALALVVIPLLLVFPSAARNTRTFGAPWSAGAAESARTRNEAPGLVSLASNVLRDTVLHLPVPGYGEAVVAIHQRLGLDPDDPRTTHLFDDSFTEVAKKWYRPLAPNEDSAGNPLHLVAAISLLVLAIARRGRFDATGRAALTIGTAAFCGWILSQVPFKWQPWSSRFDLPFFAVLAVPIGVALARLPARLTTALVVVYVFGALPALLLDVHRPLLDVQAVARVMAGQRPIPPLSILTADRTHVMFRGNPSLEDPYVRAVQLVHDSGCGVVGLELRRGDWEYPLWSLLGAAAGGGPRVRSIAVPSELAALPPEGPEPCVVVSTVAVSALDTAPGWSRELISADPFLAVHRRKDA